MRTFAEVDQAAGQYYFSSQQSGIDNRCRERMIRRCLPHVKPNGTVLELGFMDGQWTDHFLAKGCSVVAVEGALKNVEFGHNKYRSQPRVRMVRSLFDDYRPEEKFDLIHMGGMLKHLDNPGDLLRRAKGWLKPDGILTATTPNANSLHRRVGVHMGMLKDLTDLSETDKAVGNLRHYDLNSFRQLLETSGFKIIEISTSIIKPVSSDRMAEWPDDVLDALDKIASEIPDYGWYIYSISRPA